MRVQTLAERREGEDLGTAGSDMVYVAGLSLLAFISAGLTIWAQATNRHRVGHVCKPLATLSLLVLALRAPEALPMVLRCGVAAGLGLSLAGDVFLMLPPRYFVAGMGSFLAAHLAYGCAFRASMSAWPAGLLYVPFALYGLAVFGWLLPGLRGLRWPVLGYVVTIVTMAWIATGWWIEVRWPHAARAMAGALLFLLSDTALAVNRFRRPLSWSPIAALGTYYAAQWLLALSVYP